VVPVTWRPDVALSRARGLVILRQRWWSLLGIIHRLIVVVVVVVIVGILIVVVVVLVRWILVRITCRAVAVCAVPTSSVSI